MRVAVVGLGGVGGYIGASLAKTSYDVVGFARGEHLLRIQKNGLKIIEDTKEWSVELQVQELSEAQGYFDLVLFCVKSYDIAESYRALEPYIDEKTILLSFSNGVSNAQLLRHLSKSIVLDGCVYILSHIQTAGVIRKKGKVFAAVFGGDACATTVVKTVFESAELRVKTPKDIEKALWKKYIFISAFATLTSYYDKSIGYVLKHHYDEVQKTLKEIARVAKAKEIDIEEEVEKSLDVAKGLPYDASTSMHLDFQNKRQTELESLSAYIVQEARAYGVEVPYMGKMYEKLSLN